MAVYKKVEGLRVPFNHDPTSNFVIHDDLHEFIQSLVSPANVVYRIIQFMSLLHL
jgi:hypothetical protein